MPLPNPIVIPAYADPFAWCLGLVGMMGELFVARKLLRRVGSLQHHALDHLFATNVLSWGLFLVAVDRSLLFLGDAAMPVALVALEVLVVLAEAVVLRGLDRRRLLFVGGDGSSLLPRNALRISLLANLTSIGVSLLGLALLALLARGFR